MFQNRGRRKGLHADHELYQFVQKAWNRLFRSSPDSIGWKRACAGQPVGMIHLTLSPFRKTVNRLVAGGCWLNGKILHITQIRPIMLGRLNSYDKCIKLIQFSTFIFSYTSYSSQIRSRLAKVRESSSSRFAAMATIRALTMLRGATRESTRETMSLLDSST